MLNNLKEELSTLGDKVNDAFVSFMREGQRQYFKSKDVSWGQPKINQAKNVEMGGFFIFLFIGFLEMVEFQQY